MSNKTLVFLLGILVCTSFGAFSQASWEIEKNKDGIVVYTKIEEGSDFKSFKAVMVVAASTPEIIRVLKMQTIIQNGTATPRHLKS